jgi:hypothetical protein
MKFTSTTAALCATTLLAIAPIASALAQGSQLRTDTTPPAAASPGTPMSPGMPSGMTQAMPPEMMQMMQMMQKMHSGAMPRMAMMGGSLMMPGGAIQNVEGHIAFLKAELQITDEQKKPWDQFAEALRANAKTLSAASSAMMSAMMGEATKTKKMSPATQLEQQEKLLTLQLEALKRSRTALDGLNAVLSDEQKQRLNQLI